MIWFRLLCLSSLMGIFSGFMTMKMVSLRRREWFPPGRGEMVGGVALLRPDTMITGSSEGKVYAISLREETDDKVIGFFPGERMKSMQGFQDLLVMEGEPHINGWRHTWMLDARRSMHGVPIIIGRWNWNNMTILHTVLAPSIYARLSSNSWLYLARGNQSVSHYVMPRTLHHHNGNDDDAVILGVAYQNFLFLLTREWNLLVLDINASLVINHRIKYSIPMENKKTTIATSMDVSATSTPTVVRIAIGSTRSIMILDIGMLFHGNETLDAHLRTHLGHIRHLRFVNPDCLLCARENHTMDLFHWKQNKSSFRVPLDTDFTTQLDAQHPFVAADSTRSLITWESITSKK